MSLHLIKGCVVGIVVDNKDPEGMHRIKVRLPISGGNLESYWCRIITPMAGVQMGLVMIPDIGTEVLVSCAYKSMTPYILGGVYNAKEDKPEPYKNDDRNNDKRVFWSRNDHMIIFDDTEGATAVEIGAKAPTRLDVTSAPIYQQFKADEKKIIQYCDDDTTYVAENRFSIECKRFTLKADDGVLLNAGKSAILSGQKIVAQAGGMVRASSPNTEIAGPSKAPVADTPPKRASVKHPPVKNG